MNIVGITNIAVIATTIIADAIIVGTCIKTLAKIRKRCKKNCEDEVYGSLKEALTKDKKFARYYKKHEPEHYKEIMEYV